MELDIHGYESNCSKPLVEVLRVDGIVRVPIVEGTGCIAGHPVCSNQHSARFEYPQELGKHPVLVTDGWNVMQHVE
jgi:hypothetical protein